MAEHQVDTEQKWIISECTLNAGRARHYTSLLKETELFSLLSDEEIAQVLQYAEECRVAKDTQIFAEDNLSDCMYVIDNGEVVIEKRRGDTLQKLAYYTKNDVFGENGLFLSLRRRAGARTTKPATLLRFPSATVTFESIMQKSSALCNSIFNMLIVHVARRIRSVNGLISQSKRWVNTLKEQLIVDKLTGLYNITSYHEEFIPRLSDGRPVIVIMVKPRNFKRVNDSAGHDAGDATLHKLGSLFTTTLGDAGLAFRYLGSEFAIVFHGLELSVAEQLIQSAIAAASKLDLSSLDVDADFRLSFMSHAMCYPAEHSDLSSLLDTAHAAFMKVFSRE